MSLYMFITEEDRVNMRKVSYPYVNQEFQEALKYCPDLMITQHETIVKKGFFKKERIPVFNVYHESPAHDGSPYQAHFQFSGSGSVGVVIAYLHGIINGANQIKIGI